MLTVAKNVAFLLAQWRVNLSSAMAYRASFITQAIFMVVNDVLLLFFWWILLTNFPDINGWGMSNIWLMYGLSAGGFGVMAIFLGHATELSRVISEGQLDYYLALPKNVLFHVLASRTQFSAIGDLLFGLVIGYLGCRATGASYALFLLFLLTATVIVTSFYVILGSMAFFVGRSEALVEQVGQSIVTFGMYPGTIYQGMTKFIILFIVPSGFMVHLPVELLSTFSWHGFGQVMLAAAVMWGLASSLFYAGLRRYESGNQVVLRG